MRESPAPISMKLWLLRPIEELPRGDNPWEPWYDKSFGFVVRAPDEQRARELAHSNARDENRGEFLGKKTADTDAPWLDGKYSTCTELTSLGEEGIIMSDVAMA
jgi:hypothetical protein